MASYAIGGTVGRWDLRFATGQHVQPELPDPFARLPVCSPGMLQGPDGLPLPPTTDDEQSTADYPLRIDWDGIIADDPDHSDDIVRRAREVLELIWKDRADAIEKEAREILGVKELRDYFRKPGKGGFWDDHVSRYSKSRTTGLNLSKPMTRIVFIAMARCVRVFQHHRDECPQDPHETRMVSFHLTGDALWQRMERAVEKVQERLERTATTLEQAGIPYAIIGGHAVRAWVAQADEAAVRTTRDVDILLRRSDWPAAIAAMERAGFIYRHAKSIDMFLDGPGAKARDAVHVLFAGEKVRPDDLVPTPDVTETEEIQRHRTLRLEALVRMKLTSFRDKDRMHLRDMIDVELVDTTWCSRVPPELAARLKELLDNPES